MVVTIETIDALIGLNPAYNCKSNAYTKAYRMLPRKFDFTTTNYEQKVEDEFNELHKDEGVTIKHDRITIDFRFKTKQHHTMFVLKYS